MNTMPKIALSGQIKSIGVSNHNLAEIKRANEILGAAGLKASAVQTMRNLGRNMAWLLECKDVPPMMVVGGVPARIIKKITPITK